MSKLLAHGELLDSLVAAHQNEHLPHALLLSGPEGIGKRTMAVRLARTLVAGDDAESRDAFDRGVHERFVCYRDLERPVPIRRADLIESDLSEDDLLDAYRQLTDLGWIRGHFDRRGADVIDLVHREPAKFTGRKGIPFAEIVEREIAALARARGISPASLTIARRLFSLGPSSVMFRRTFGIELVNGKGDGEMFRSLASFLANSSGSGTRVAIVDDAHRMTDAAENAFLKTLEEPPPRTHLILVTSEPYSLLATTRSRCATFALDSIQAGELSHFLQNTQAVPEASADWAAHLAEGSLRRALELCAVDFAAREQMLERLAGELADADLGAVLARFGKRLSEASAAGQREGERAEARLLLELLTLVTRDLVMCVSNSTTRFYSGLSPERLRAIASRASQERWEEIFAKTERALADINEHVEPRLAIEALFAEALPATSR